MATLPNPESATVTAIYAMYAAKVESPRRYLGASSIGKPCERALWLEFRWCGRETFSGRMLRLFQRGALEEHVFASDLRAIGCDVRTEDDTGDQFSVTAASGHFGGHMDGVALGIPEAPKTWHLLEMKTHNAKSFAALVKSNVREAKPEHWVQMQVYMHLGGLERALYLAVNKDTDDLYAERVKYDKSEAVKIIAKAERIVSAKRPPERIGVDADDFACKFCCHKSRCYGTATPEAAVPIKVSCRSCVHATPVIEPDGLGRWRCEKHDKTLTEAEQLAACEDHLLIPDLVTFAQYIDAGTDPAGDWILYQNNTGGEQWANSKNGGGYTSAELAMLPANLIGVKGENEGAITVDDIKRELGGVVTEVSS